jgi:translation initiation factor IF-2
MILLIAEMKELKSNLEASVKGIVIESHLDKLRGPIATALILEGVLKEGDIIATDLVYGKAKRMETFNFETKKEFYPGDPVIIYGFQEPPQVGDNFSIFLNIGEAKTFTEMKKEEVRQARLEGRGKQFEIAAEKKVLNIIIKSDVIGTIEAIENILLTIPQDKILVNIIEMSVGEVNENDVKKAVASNANIFAFNVKTTTPAKQLLEKEKMKVNEVDVIYRIVEGIKVLMEKMLKPERVKVEIGKLKVTVLFKVERNRQIIGGKVVDGEIKKGYTVDIVRDKEVIEEGKITTLQKNKKEVDVAKRRDEVAVMYKGKKKIKEGDYLVVSKIEKRAIEL